MSEIKENLSDKQRLYRDIFLRAKDALIKKLQSIEGKENKLDFLKNDVSKDILFQLVQMNECKEHWGCAKCGACCKIASSEFSPSELKEKAQNGDKFAKSFLEVFVPYEDKESASAQFEDYISLLKERNLYDEVYFYHCPKIGEDNLCSDYENRPMVCRDFPNNPLVIFPPKCGYKAWGDEFEVRALFLNAMSEIVGYFIENLEQ